MKHICFKKHANLRQLKGRVQFKWAMAGRNKIKLEAFRAELVANAASELFHDVAELPLIEAEVDDEASLASLAASTAVLITTVGPYSKHGLLVVKVTHFFVCWALCSTALAI
jgi:short subunit dehydrogenase-like uncharacterized protein